MVLQNKYKAQASRRYNAARGGAIDGRGRGRGGMRRGGIRHYDNAAFPSLQPGEAGEEEASEEDAVDEGEGTSESSNDEELNQIAARGKYARRKMESNAWRYQEKEIDPLEDNVEPEPEVDLSGLLERVAKLDSSRTSQALSSQEAAEASASAAEIDIDHSLLYLLDRQRERERRKVAVEETSKAKLKPGLSASELKLLEMEGKRLLEERERERKHYGRAQILKSQQPKTISINIGENRRKDDDVSKAASHSSSQSFAKRRNVNLTALYDDEDGEPTDGHSTDVDAFLAGLVDERQQPPDTALTALTDAALTESQKPSTASSAAAFSLSQKKEDEDFLDSII